MSIYHLPNTILLYLPVVKTLERKIGYYTQVALYLESQKKYSWVSRD